MLLLMQKPDFLKDFALWGKNLSQSLIIGENVSLRTEVDIISFLSLQTKHLFVLLHFFFSTSRISIFGGYF